LTVFIDSPSHRSRGANAPAAGWIAAAALILALFAFFYYRSYALTGFNVADDGHFAQVAFEFVNGADPHDIRFGYGVAWFKAGEVLFRLFGSNYAVAQIFYYGMNAASALLGMVIVARASGSLWAASATGAALVLTPAFPATAFYAFCPLLNIWALMGAAENRRNLRPTALVPAAAAVSLTFMIRPDFGYVFSAPLMLVWAAATVAGGARLGAALAGWAAAAFVAVQAPLLIDGWREGYLDLVLADILRYPRLLFDYVVVGLGLRGPPVAAGAAGAGTLLARPPMSAVWGADPVQAGLAFLIYAPPVLLALFAVQRVIIPALRAASGWAGDGGSKAASRAVILIGASAGLPHYFLFRPDLAHVANFMPAFLTLCAVYAADLIRGDGDGDRRREDRGVATRLAHWGGAAALGGVALFYLHYGSMHPGTGSSAAAAGRDAPFVTAHGVDTVLSPGEIGWLKALHDLVLANSKPLDRIVCVPFCPGVAFMTGRRMLFREYYVDDSFLVSDPGWIDRAIALTARERPPVVVVLGWAVNGTEISRFDVWAAPYVAFLLSTGYQAVAAPGGVVYVAPPTEGRREPAR
jgi:hypothetical protein